MWSAAELSGATNGAMRTPFGATGVSIDTRTLQPGDLFVALAGENGDGHDHVAAALAAGAAGAMVHRDVPGTTLLVHDTRDALWALAAAARRRFTGRMIAVTGSAGKTTTKEMLRVILSAAGLTHAAHASYNNHWGVPLTLARLPPDAAFCVAEIGTNHPGEIGPLSVLVRSDVVIITNVEPAHIGHFGSIEAIADEKSAIGEGLRPGGIAVLPGDSPMLPRLSVRAEQTRLFGTAQVRGGASDAAGSDVDATVDGHDVHFRVNAPGPHMILNALAALTAAAALGVDGSTSMGGFAPLAGRGEHRALPNGAVLIDESYNANPASVRAALVVLRGLTGRRVAVLGDMLELGSFGPAEHAGLAEAVDRAADRVFTCGTLMRGLFDALPAAKRGAHADDAAGLASLVVAAPGDIILVKGSLGSRMAVIVRTLEGAA